MRFVAILLLLLTLAWSQQPPRQPTASNISVDFGSKPSKSTAFVSCTSGGTMHVVALDSSNTVMSRIPESIRPAQRLLIFCNTPEEETVSQECIAVAQAQSGGSQEQIDECLKTRLRKIINSEQ